MNSEMAESLKTATKGRTPRIKKSAGGWLCGESANDIMSGWGKTPLAAWCNWIMNMENNRCK